MVARARSTGTSPSKKKKKKKKKKNRGLSYLELGLECLISSRQTIQDKWQIKLQIEEAEKEARVDRVTTIVANLVQKTGDKTLWVGSMALTESESHIANFEKSEDDEARILMLKSLAGVGN
jgi:hypothetical protein